ncbi:MAG TPA: hypothetical protein VLA56_18370 [Pseudomonadales bacterium]|nr:hypothetical protein [Pseudomonadales bacterium]
MRELTADEVDLVGGGVGRPTQARMSRYAGLLRHGGYSGSIGTDGFTGAGLILAVASFGALWGPVTAGVLTFAAVSAFGSFGYELVKDMHAITIRQAH